MSLATPVLLALCCLQSDSAADYTFEVVRLVDWELPLQLSGGLEDQSGPFLIGDVRRGTIHMRNQGANALEVHVASKDCGCSRQPTDERIWSIPPKEEIVMTHDLIIAGEENAVEMTVSILRTGVSKPVPVMKAVTSAKGINVLTASSCGVIRSRSGPPVIAIDFDIDPQYFTDRHLPTISGFALLALEREGASGTGFYTAPFFPDARWPEFELPPIQLRSWREVERERLSFGSQEQCTRSLELYGFSGLGGECNIRRVPAEPKACLVEVRVWGVPDARTIGLEGAGDGSWRYDLFLPHEVLENPGDGIVLCELWRHPNRGCGWTPKLGRSLPEIHSSC